jgi:D-alanyl-D-alanine carboxypeptidase
LFTEKFAPLGPGEFRMGQEDFSPERARFDGIVDGRAQRLTISGVPLYRRETQ